MALTGWFEGLTLSQMEAGASEYMGRNRGFVVEWWGLIKAEPGDRRLAFALELGDRATHDAAKENAEDRRDRQDWVVTKALDARPALFTELLSA
jgi:hypothetical protein